MGDERGGAGIVERPPLPDDVARLALSHMELEGSD